MEMQEGRVYTWSEKKCVLSSEALRINSFSKGVFFTLWLIFKLQW
jgi:hypothetical protein